MQAVPNYRLTFETIGGTSVPVSYNSGQEGPPGAQGPSGRTSTLFNGNKVYGVPRLTLALSRPGFEQHGSAWINPYDGSVSQFDAVSGTWNTVGQL